ncbi:YggS family pyridoxal phosphate-dependent enzyme [Nitratidesulfovibrio sp. 1201_IL3209]|uniref:YggS family pyridoxal phosphate-dependent enzyme n=1 Tax=Nitratidesulfovibrio sp. 1201_IL3209 TaxID=3084053 RepID=UPI002FD8877A
MPDIAVPAFLPPEAAHALLDRWAAVRARVDGAARAAGRDPAGVTLVAVSKYHPAATVAALVAAGQRDFGENYVQEALRKQAEVADMTGMGPDAAPRWHFIGHLQSNKAKDVVGRFALLHTVDSETLARKLDQRLAAMPAQGAGGAPPVQDILLQVNIGDEAQKSGVDPDGLPALADAVLALPRLRLLGLMCMPPIFDDGEASRPFFARLRELRDGLAVHVGLPLPHLSMGMSHDVEVAVAEGATIVRVGTDIFGPRPERV